MNRQADILIIGLEQVLPKVANWAKALESQHIYSIIYAQDVYGLTRQLKAQLPARVFLVPEFWGRLSRWALGFPLFVLLLLWYRPRHIEIYDPELCNGFWLVCARLAHRLGFPLVVLNRGGLYGYGQLPPTRQEQVKRIYHLCRLVIIKELYMESTLYRYALATKNKIVLIHNRISVKDEPSFSRLGAPIVLYLNSFPRRKQPDLCIEAAALVTRQMKDVAFWFVGDLPQDMSHANSVWDRFSGEELQEMANKLGVQNNVRILSFSTDPGYYLDQASIFLLPADQVFCNFSLLEAMERGVPPIVADVEGSERIVDDGVNGFRVQQTPEAIAQKIIELLTDEPRRQAMGQAARAKIIRDFNLADMPGALAQIYRERVWGAA